MEFYVFGTSKDEDMTWTEKGGDYFKHFAPKVITINIYYDYSVFKILRSEVELVGLSVGHMSINRVIFQG